MEQISALARKLGKDMGDLTQRLEALESVLYETVTQKVTLTADNVTGRGSGYFARDKAYMFDGISNQSNLYTQVPQITTFDLGEIRDISTIHFVTYYFDNRRYNDVRVMLSDDGENHKTIFEADGPLQGGKDGTGIYFQGVKARYVHIHMNGSNVNSFNHFMEFTVWERVKQLRNLGS